MGDTWMRPLRKGIDYDLVNISLIGFDPITGKTYEQCQDEWDAERNRLTARVDKIRWWDLPERYRCAKQIAIMQQRLGMP